MRLFKHNLLKESYCSLSTKLISSYFGISHLEPKTRYEPEVTIDFIIFEWKVEFQWIVRIYQNLRFFFYLIFE